MPATPAPGRASGHSGHAGLARSCCPRTTKGKIAQQTEDLVGPYELHDFFLYYVLRFGFRPGEDLPPGAVTRFGAIYDPDAHPQVAENLLPPLLHPAVQAQLPARRREGRLRDPQPQRGLADAQRRRRKTVAGRS